MLGLLPERVAALQDGLAVWLCGGRSAWWYGVVPYNWGSCVALGRTDLNMC